MALNPYNRENSTYMPIGEPVRPDGVVGKYKSDELDNEVQGVIYALLMQYAKIDRENAEKRARQFAKILYEYAVRLINDLDVNNSVIATKIVNAVDAKTASELKMLVESGDFEKELGSVATTVQEYLSTLLKVANGSVVTSGQLGLPNKTVTPVTPASVQTEQTKFDTEFSSTFIETVRLGSAASIPSATLLAVPQPAMATALQKLAVNAVTFFNTSVKMFTGGLAGNTMEHLENLKQTISSFSSVGMNKKPERGGEDETKVDAVESAMKREPPGLKLQGEIAKLVQDDKKEEKELGEWSLRSNAVKQELQVAEKIASTIVFAPVKLASTLFFKLSDQIKRTYRKAREGGFLNFLFSIEGLLTFGLGGYLLYKTVFGKVGEEFKSMFSDVFKGALKLFGIKVDDGGNDGQGQNSKKDESNWWKDSLKPMLNEMLDNLFGADEDDPAQHPDIQKVNGLLAWLEEEGNWYKTLWTSGDGISVEMLIDHGVENLDRLDKYLNKLNKRVFGVTIDEWFARLGGQDNQIPTDDGDRGLFGRFVEKIKGFWDTVRSGELFRDTLKWLGETKIGRFANEKWNLVKDVAKTIYAKFKPFLSVAAVAAPLILAAGTLMTPPVTFIISTVGKVAHLLMALNNMAFMKPVMGAIGNLLRTSPMAGLLVAGLAMGLGALGIGIWNAFQKTPKDDGSIVPFEHFAISMGLAVGQTDKYGVEDRLANMRKDLLDYTTGLEFGPQKPLDFTMEAVNMLGEGLMRFEENYRDAMANQDKKNKGTLHYYILNRANDSKISRTSWARILAEIPFLGIGAGMIHNELYNSFVEKLDEKFPGKNEKTWNAVSTMMKKMKEVDMTFRRLFAMTTPGEVQNFYKSVRDDLNAVKMIYDWTHGDGNVTGFNLNTHMAKMFGLDFAKQVANIPRAIVSILPIGLYTNAVIDMNGKQLSLNLGSPLDPSTPTGKTSLSLLLGGIADEVEDVTGGGDLMKFHINTHLAAQAFVNYMKRPKSNFYSWEPWEFKNRDETGRLSAFDGDEKLFRMRDLVKNVFQDKSRSIEKINSQMLERVRGTQEYRRLKGFDGQNDSKSMAEVIYILGAILQMCNEME